MCVCACVSVCACHHDSCVHVRTCMCTHVYMLVVHISFPFVPVLPQANISEMGFSTSSLLGILSHISSYQNKWCPPPVASCSSPLASPVLPPPLAHFGLGASTVRGECYHMDLLLHLICLCLRLLSRVRARPCARVHVAVRVCMRVHSCVQTC